MSEFMLSVAIVIGLAGVFMIVAPQRAAIRLRLLSPLPNDAASLRIFRIGGGVLIALAAVLLIKSASE
ncbi:hypothetical protein [Sphingomonas sp. DT-204]|uniref:hypothetical protein n=1 Tax=Sphingomonas sp. DT-204 TaxID=3396166 RepID=UPI003F1C76E6